MERGVPMKTKLARLISFVGKFDLRYIQFAYFILALAGYVILRSPSDGGTGPY
jgi:hypothetical protein